MLCGACLLLGACSEAADETGKDQEKPLILDSPTASPIDCQVYRRGDVIPFHYAFADNTELGNYNIEIHNNFDHHAHSTSAGDCPLEAKKTPHHPWVYNEDRPIPEGLQQYEALLEIPIPATIDPGDYHFMVRLTDRAGWQTFKAVSIKIEAS